MTPARVRSVVDPAEAGLPGPGRRVTLVEVTEPTSAPAGTTALIETAYDTWSDVADRADRLLQTVGMATADLVLLRRIGGPPGRRRVDLAAAIRRTPSQTVRAVAPWVKLGYVMRTAEQGFVLTQDGAAVVAEASLLLDRHLRLDGPAPTTIDGDPGQG